MEIDEVYSNFRFGFADLPDLAATALNETSTNEFNRTHLLNAKHMPKTKDVIEIRNRIKASGSMEAFVDGLLERRCFLSAIVRTELCRYLSAVSAISSPLRKKVG